MNNNIYPRQYVPNYNINQQNMYEQQIDNEINSLQQMKERLKNNTMQQPTAINQTFQIAPQNNNGLKFVNSIEDVQKELAIVETPFVNSSYSTLWIKNAKGDIRTFELIEIIPKDDKDILIEDLQKQVSRLSNQIKEMNRYEQQYDKTSNEYEGEQFNEPIENKTTSNVSNAKSSKSKSK